MVKQCVEVDISTSDVLVGEGGSPRSPLRTSDLKQDFCRLDHTAVLIHQIFKQMTL
jgi:hypothetical protein